MSEHIDDPHRFWSTLAARQQVSLRRLVAPAPDAATLARILGAAAHAPDHGLLLPWRFILIPAQRRADLGAAFAEALQERDPASTEQERASAHAKAFHAPCLLVAVLRDDPASTIDRSEKLVSLGCAIQNVLLATQASEFACGLASGAAMRAASMRRVLQLTAHEEEVCFIGIGTPSTHKPARPRPALTEYFSSL